ncbi:hypothetical protein, partial [Sphingobacterium bovisgrunnientis]|uniref:hypothetical protein n=1 Tax=Sphingobacterium bovisgrunnientis TaxID=1874697 RepID=UPI00195E25D3
PYKYINFDGKTYISELEVKAPIVLDGEEMIISCYLDNSMGDHYHILLGMSFLQVLNHYNINKEGIYITHNNKTLFCSK